MTRIPYDALVAELYRVLETAGFSSERARQAACIFADNTCDGVPSHGLNRFPGFVRNVVEGRIDPAAEPECVGSFGALEQWDGNLGAGVLNATRAMERAVELAREMTLGCVAMRNTNHWMRAATYGLQAAASGCMAMCWTNTTRLMPPHGSAEQRVGNNPLCIAIPAPDGDTVVLDMALSQFSGGRTDILRRMGKTFPIPGGYDEDGQLTTDPGAVRRSGRPLPIGHWKGSGLALCLDLMGSLLSGGLATCQIAAGADAGCSQVYLAFDITAVRDESLGEFVDSVLADLTSAEPLPGQRVTYPGQRSAETRRSSMAEGVPVDDEFWEETKSL